VLSTNSAKQLWLQVALSAFAAAMSLWFIVLPLKHVRAALSGDPISIVFLLGMCVIMWGLIAQIRLAIEKTMQESKCP
jgi:predicted phage tail protein